MKRLLLFCFCLIAIIVLAFSFRLLLSPSKQVQPSVSCFSSNGVCLPFNAVNFPSAWYYSGRTYVAYLGRSSVNDCELYVTYFDHKLGTWSKAVKVDNALTLDYHGCPAIMVDNKGYIHVFHACDDFGFPFVHYRSKNPQDITVWAKQTNVENGSASYDWSYPKIVRINNMVWLEYSFRNGTCNGIYSRIVLMKKSIDNGEKWGLSQPIILNGTEGNNLYGVYQGGCEINAMQIYTTWCYISNQTLRKTNVYCAYLNTIDSKMYSLGGLDLGSAINYTSANLYCKVYDTKNNCTNYAPIHIDSKGNPWIIYINGLGYPSAGGAFSFYSIYWNGSAWSRPTKIVDTVYISDFGDFIINSNHDITAYLTVGTGYFYDVLNGQPIERRGGDIEKWKWNGTSWTYSCTILSQNESGIALDFPTVPVNCHFGVELVFCQIKDNDYSANLKLYSYDGADNLLASSHDSKAAIEASSTGDNASVPIKGSGKPRVGG
jgi:hypothetical protein